MSYHLNAAIEQHADDVDEELDGRPTIPFMRAIPHLMPPLPVQDDVEPNDPPAWQHDPESDNEFVPMPESSDFDSLNTTTFIPGTNVAMWPLPGQEDASDETSPDSSAKLEAVVEADASPDEAPASQPAAKSSSLRPWFIGTFTVLFLEAAIVATANLYRAGHLSFIW